MRSVLRASGLLFLLVFLLLLPGILWYSFADFRPFLRARAGQLVRAVETPVASDTLCRTSWLDLIGSTGFRAEAGLLVPVGNDRRLPAAILLGGKATGKHAIDYVLDRSEMAVLALDYPYEPRPSYTLPTFAADIPAIQGALFDMIPATQLAVDYLTQRADIDTNRIVVIGYSFGAPFVPMILRNDPRPSVAVIVYGGGGLTSLIRHNVRRYEGPIVSTAVGWISGLLLHPLEPLRWVDRIAPRPVLFLNGSNDEQIPRANADALFEAAREPKTRILLPSGHVRPDNVRLTRMILDSLRGELGRMGILPPGSPTQQSAHTTGQMR